MHDLSIAALLDGYAARRFTPVDAMRAVLARIEAWQPHDIAGLWQFDPHTALEDAEASTARWARGTPCGPLDGIPATIKELLATKGLPVPQGCAGTTLTPAHADSPVPARLREAGAIIFARTSVPDLGMLSSGLSSFHALARNPWNPAANPGGSSAGAATAAAAGYGPIHIGTDIGGSVRLPAAWTGLAGFKPSFGRVPIDPFYTGRCAGPMARCVDDLARIMPVISKPDRRDPTSLPPGDLDWDAHLPSVSGLKIGLMLEPGCGMAPEAAVLKAAEDAARLFEAHGATIVPVSPVLDRALLDGFDAFWRARAWAELRNWSEDARSRVLPAILDWALPGAGVRGADAIAGYGGSFALRRRCTALFDELDAVISPVTPNVSFPAEWASPLNDPARPFEHIAYTLPWNFSEQPAISLNGGFGTGHDGKTMPIGIQIVTDRYADARVLQLGRWFEQHSPATIKAWPEPTV